MNHLRLPLTHARCFSARRAFTSGVVKRDLGRKYEERLRKRAEELGAKDVNELKDRLRKEAEAEKTLKRAEQVTLEATQPSETIGSSPPPASLKTRKDSSPIKPLDTFLNLPKLLSSDPPLTSAQISALWTAYHTRREGVLCATVPLDVYEQMIARARRWGQFVVPLLRGSGEQEGQGGIEMFFIEWGMHHSPTLPPLDKDELGFPISPPPNPPSTTPNPPIATLLLTPLQEYKYRQSYAAPHLALTFYTDLATSHGIVLLRGEITPAQQGAGRWMLSLAEAQALIVTMQKFYLGGEDGEEVLRCFHERPDEFEWERLVQVGQI